jgi:hypothetical protein
MYIHVDLCIICHPALTTDVALPEVQFASLPNLRLSKLGLCYVILLGLTPPLRTLFACVYPGRDMEYTYGGIFSIKTRSVRPTLAIEKLIDLREYLIS